ncbi:hypothetical protein [Enterocloster citroniae]
MINRSSKEEMQQVMKLADRILVVIEEDPYSYQDVMDALDSIKENYEKKGRDLLDHVSIQEVARFEGLLNAGALENNPSFLEESAPVEAGDLLWAFEKDKKTGSVTAIPMNGDRIVIHGKEEAEIFCEMLTGCFQGGGDSESAAK